MAKVTVNIYDEAYIPSLGKGPFKNKIINEELFRALKRLGYLIETIDNPVLSGKKLVFDLNEKTKLPEKEKAPAEEESLEEVKEEVPAEEEVKEESLEEAPAEEEKGLEISDEEAKFLSKDAKRSEIIKFLEDHEIKFNEEATIKELLALIGLKR